MEESTGLKVALFSEITFVAQIFFLNLVVAKQVGNFLGFACYPFFMDRNNISFFWILTEALHLRDMT